MPNQIPRSSEIIGAGLDSLSGYGPGIARASAFQFANNGIGRYADLFAGWDAQCQLVLRRLAAECRAARLKGANGDELVDLARSEFETDPDLLATTAIGTVVLTRASGSAGVIPEGCRFKRLANASSNPPIPAATYRVTQDTPIGSGVLTIAVPIEATQSGPAPSYNWGLMSIAGGGSLFAVDTLFDPSFGGPRTAHAYEAAGGADVKGDLYLRNEAYAYATGKYAPTLGAIYAGALRSNGVRHVAVFDVPGAIVGGVLQPPYCGVLVADGAWASGQRWLASVKQQLVDPVTGAVGIGPRILLGSPTTMPVRVPCEVILADANFIAYTAEITANIQARVTSYFNDRVDWYTYRTDALRAVISKADHRILSCVSARVLEVPSDTDHGSSLTFSIGVDGLIANHFELVQNGVSVTYDLPT